MTGGVFRGVEYDNPAAVRLRTALDEFGSPDIVQELLRESFLQTEIPESLKYGAFAGKVCLYTMRAIKPA
jgi:hypothetical protein